MNYFCRCIFIVGVTLQLMGCSYINSKFNWIEQRQKEYLATSTTAPLQIPKTMDTTKIQTSYPIPPATSTAPTQPDLLPPNSLAAQINQGKSLSKQSSVAPQTSSISRTAIASYVKNDTLIVNQPITTAWQQIETAIDIAGYKIAFKNQKTFTYYIVDTSSTRGKITRESPIYQIHLRQIPLGIEVSVTDNVGNKVDLNTANRILDNIYNGLPKTEGSASTNSHPVNQSVTPNSAPTSRFGQLMQRFFN